MSSSLIWHFPPGRAFWPLPSPRWLAVAQGSTLPAAGHTPEDAHWKHAIFGCFGLSFQAQPCPCLALCPQWKHSGLQGPHLGNMLTGAFISEGGGEEDVRCARRNVGNHTGWIGEHPGRPGGRTGPRKGVSVVGGWLGCDEAWGQPVTEWVAGKLQEEEVRAAATCPAYPTFQSLITAAGPSC